jgi:hypothetical protein
MVLSDPIRTASLLKRPARCCRGRQESDAHRKNLPPIQAAFPPLSQCGGTGVPRNPILPARRITAAMARFLLSFP